MSNRPHTATTTAARRRTVSARLRVALALAATATVSGGAGAAASVGDDAGTPSVQAPVDGGPIEIVDADRPDVLLGDGTSTTIFTLRVPQGAACPGDSANDDWRIQSFVVPASDDPGALTYGTIWPEGEGRYAVYGVDTRPYTHQLTGQQAGPGLPGPIPTPPPLTLGVFPAGTLPEGDYRIGLACTLFRETAIFWDAEIRLTADPSVDPGGMRWTRIDGEALPDPSSEESSSTRRIASIALGLLALAGVAYLFMQRRPDPPAVSPTSAADPSPSPVSPSNPSPGAASSITPAPIVPGSSNAVRLRPSKEPE